MEIRGIFNVFDIAASTPGNARSDRLFISTDDPLIRLNAFVISYNFSVRGHALKIDVGRRTAKKSHTHKNCQQPDDRSP
ncbi:hypothetical protein OAV89_00450 [bacterium]|nr:hypothetical protein [Gammaproteobacteria bacterium]MDC3339855.1 hypothetical protein [bacterium]